MNRAIIHREVLDHLEGFDEDVICKIMVEALKKRNEFDGTGALFNSSTKELVIYGFYYDDV